MPYDPADLPEDCPVGPDPQGPILADLDTNGSVDQIDFGIFQRCFSGAGEPGDAGCAV